MRFVTCAAVVAAALVACKGHKSKLDEMGAPQVAHTGSAAPAKENEAPKLPPVTPAKLAPVINVLGPENVVPSAVVIELATPIIDQSQVGGVSSKTKLSITPEVDLVLG